MSEVGYITINMVDGSCVTLENRSRHDFTELHEWQSDDRVLARVFTSGKALHSITRAHIVKISFYPNQEV
jgi:hypothetical protein